ncbi:MAG: MerR family DNA-binding protein [Phycisphaerae bacterium]|nr:MerR family DNA-binding protein [Phycisphaerae bacterium]
MERLRFIRSAQAIGFALDDIRRLLELDEAGLSACRSKVRPLLERRLAEIDRKLGDLKHVRSMLARALNRCRASSGECAVLRELRPAKKRSRS